MADSKKSGVSTGIRIAVAVGVGIILSLFILFWDGGFIPYKRYGLSNWFGRLIIIPFLAVVLSFGANVLIQRLSCSQIQVMNQLQRAAYAPLSFFIMWTILYVIPGLRWPVEGLIQNLDPTLCRGFSSAFYVFWVSLYTQGAMNGLAQMCLK